MPLQTNPASSLLKQAGANTATSADISTLLVLTHLDLVVADPVAVEKVAAGPVAVEKVVAGPVAVDQEVVDPEVVDPEVVDLVVAAAAVLALRVVDSADPVAVGPVAADQEVVDLALATQNTMVMATSLVNSLLSMVGASMRTIANMLMQLPLPQNPIPRHHLPREN